MYHLLPLVPMSANLDWSWLLRLLCILLPVGLLLVGPEDAVLKRLWQRKPLRLWHYETTVVFAFIAAIVLLSGNKPIEWVGFTALALNHGRNSVMFRFVEMQQKLAPADPHHVECWRWNQYYFLLGEVFWAAYFILHHSWAALSGVVVFVGYAQWRKFRSRKAG